MMPKYLVLQTAVRAWVLSRSDLRVATLFDLLTAALDAQHEMTVGDMGEELDALTGVRLMNEFNEWADSKLRGLQESI